MGEYYLFMGSFLFYITNISFDIDFSGIRFAKFGLFLKSLRGRDVLTFLRLFFDVSLYLRRFILY